MRIARRLVHALLIVLTLVIGATSAAVIVTQTAWFRNWMRGYIVREANQYLNGQLSIQRLGGNLFFGVELENIGLSMDGSQVVAVKDLGLDYNVFELVTKGLSIDNIRLNKPVIYLRREGDAWSISRLVKKQRTEADRSGPGRPITIDDIGISDGSLVIDGPVGTSGVDVPKRFDHLDAKLAFKYEPVRYSVEITHVSFRGSDPEIGLNALSGGVAVKEDTLFVDKLALRTEETSVLMDGAVQHYLTKPVFNLQVSSDKLSLPEIARLVPALAGVQLQPAFEVKVDGPLDRLGVEMNVRSSAGNAIAKVVADVEAPGQSVVGELSTRHLDLAPILKNPKQRSDITADAKFDVRGAEFSNLDSLRGTVDVTSPRIVAAGYVADRLKANAKLVGRRIAVDAHAGAYGASASAAGRVTLPASTTNGLLAYDLHGQVRRLDLAKLPRDLKAPSAATDINADYHVAGSVPSGSTNTKRGTQVAGDLRFQPSTVPGARIAQGSTVGFTMQGQNIGYRADATVADLDLQRIGEAFQVPALANDRYKSSINGHVMAEGHGTSLPELNLTASGALTDSSILGGKIPQLTFAASVADDAAHVTAKGAVADVDPSVASGKDAMKGSVGGDVDIDATVSNLSGGVTADTVEATAKVNLQPSTVGGLTIDQAALDADYHQSVGIVRTLDVKGRDLNLHASGTLALNETDQSNLTFHADSPSLDELGKLVDQPLAGIATVDGTVTGNKRDLNASGNLVADGLKYGDNGALNISAMYTAKVPDLAVDRASVSAHTHATFVTIASQNINEIDAQTDYQNKQLTFDATAKQPQRSLAATGALLLHPDHQEIHLQRLALDTQGQQWQLASGGNATVQYGGDVVEVNNIELVSGNQQISAHGTFGRPGDSLDIALKNVNLASVDAMMLRPPQLAGQLNATSTIGGTKDSPRVKAEFEIVQGGFRQFKYDSFGGTIDYGGKGLNVDAKLQQNPSTWITAKGYVPVAAFSAETGKGPRTHHEAASREDAFDLHVDSSPIDLGLVQGFTTALTNVRGTMQAKVDVTGAADDPHPSGEITVANGAFTVEPTGVSYTDLDGRIQLAPDTVHIESITIVDNHQEQLTISGDLAVHERALGEVNIYANAYDFKVIDNKMGNVRIDSNLRVAGGLTQPRIEGDLGINTGVINLDTVLANVGTSAYDTKPTEFATAPSDNRGQTPPPTAFEALRMNVHVTIPDDLVIKGSDLRLPDAPIGLGAMNLTLGGDVRATKDPGGMIKLVGNINTIRGYYDFQGRRFDILRDGAVRFVGLEELNPTLDIKTRRLIQGVDARVNIQGTLRKPEIVLSSTPPLDQADILALIVFNQPLNQLGEGQQISLAQRAQQMATGALAGTLANSIGNALNLDQFEINTAPEGGGVAQLTVGQQVGRNLYVKVQQGIGAQSQTNFILEYELTKYLRLQTNVLQGSTTQQQLFQRMQGSGADLLFFFSY